MRAEGIDPRHDSALEEDPDYRVDFWDLDGASDEWLLTEVKDLHEALR